MSNTITIAEIEQIVGVAATRWERNGVERHYINVPGAAYKIYAKSGKLHFALGKGRSTSDANAIAAKLLGCNVTDRYSKAAPYVIIEG